MMLKLYNNNDNNNNKPCQPVLQTYRCIGTIRAKHLDESHWKALEQGL